MAIYRQVHTTFWQDDFVLDLTPEEKYFYLYLMTNSKTNQSGCYEISKRVMQFETGYNLETVEKLLERFIQYGKIEYNDTNKEVFLINWSKYNWTTSPKVLTCIVKEVKTIKTKDFFDNLNRVLIGYGYGIDIVPIEVDNKNKNNNNNNKENKNNKENNICADKIKDLFNVTCSNLSKIKSLSNKRISHIKQREKTLGDFNVDWEEYFVIVNNSQFLTGKTKTSVKWKANFDWLINEGNMMKVLEGNYSQKSGFESQMDTINDWVNEKEEYNA